MIEILSILYKTISKIEDDVDLVRKTVIREEILSDMQILLVVKHNVLLRCVFESILTIFEWAAASEPPVEINSYFCNSFTLSKLLIILESFSDDFRILACDTITYLFRNNQ